MRGGRLDSLDALDLLDVLDILELLVNERNLVVRIGRWGHFGMDREIESTEPIISHFGTDRGIESTKPIVEF